MIPRSYARPALRWTMNAWSGARCRWRWRTMVSDSSTVRWRWWRWAVVIRSIPMWRWRWGWWTTTVSCSEGWRWTVVATAKLGTRPIDPVLALRIPGCGTIMAVPVGPNAERGDADAQRRPHLNHRHVRALIGIGDIAGVEPTTIRTNDHVTPFKIALARFYRYRGATLNDRDNGVLRSRSRSKIGRLGRVSQPCRRQRRPDQQGRSQKPCPFQAFHFGLPL